MAEVPSPTGAFLVALTPESMEAIRARAINIPYLPFRVGRESRRARWTGRGLVAERRVVSAPNNDLYLPEMGDPINVSREHFLIDKGSDGFFLEDRGSACGCIVEGVLVGGDGKSRRSALRDHDVIIIGTSSSPFVFKFRIES